MAGYVLASVLRGEFAGWRCLAFLAGMSLVIACGCVINNVLDRGLDAKMARTKQRALVTGAVSPRQALIYGVILGLAGFWLLFFRVNGLTTALGALGLFFYLAMYGFYKRRSSWGTVVGSVSGAIPITAGYVAVTDSIDGAAVILFLAMVGWQMPHFYAIAMYRLGDYKKAGLPVLPIKKGLRRTKLSILAYIVAFTLAAGALTAFGYTGYSYLAVMASLGLYWLFEGLDGLKAADDAAWARHMFRLSLIVLLVWCVMVAFGALLP